MNPAESICCSIEQNIQQYTGGSICVLGNSPFTDAVKRRAKQFGLTVYDTYRQQTPTVIDHQYSGPMLACSEAMYSVLKCLCGP